MSLQTLHASEHAQATVQRLGRQLHLHKLLFDAVNRPLMQLEQMAQRAKTAFDQVKASGWLHA